MYGSNDLPTEHTEIYVGADNLQAPIPVPPKKRFVILSVGTARDIICFALGSFIVIGEELAHVFLSTEPSIALLITAAGFLGVPPIAYLDEKRRKNHNGAA